MNMRQLPSEERPREKLLRAGKENLSTTEILAILLRSGTKDRSALELASDLITISPDGIGYLAECRPEELASIRGIGLTKACEILAAVELGKRIASRPSAKRIRISSAKDIAEIFMERMRYYKGTFRKSHVKREGRNHRRGQYFCGGSLLQHDSSQRGICGCCTTQCRICGVFT